jgi:hypothetical protein
MKKITVGTPETVPITEFFWPEGLKFDSDNSDIIIGKKKSYPCRRLWRPIGLWDDEASAPKFLNNRLTDGGEDVSLTLRPPFTSRKIPGTYFC